MSYDLYFYRKVSSAKSDEEIHRWVCKTILEPRYKSEDGNFWFNPHTGVYFSFEYSVAEPDPDEEEENDGDRFDGFVSSNISFNINYVRADFFGREAFRVVDEILDATDLYYFNPQGDDDAPVGKSSGGALYEEWSRQNDSWLRTIVGLGESKYYMPREKTDWIWEYNDRLAAQREKMGENYFVPEISFLVEDATKTPLSFCVWSESIPFVLPETDLVAIYRKRKKFLFKTVEELGFLPYARVIDEFGPHFERYAPHCLILHPDEAAAVKNRFQKMPMDTASKDRYTGLAVENLINVPPEEFAKEEDFIEETHESGITIRRRRQPQTENN